MKEWIVFCGWCGAEPRTPCMDPEGNDVKYIHPHRKYLYQKTKTELNDINKPYKVYGIHFILNVDSTERIVELFHQMKQEIEPDEFCRYWLTENESIIENPELNKSV